MTFYSCLEYGGLYKIPILDKAQSMSHLFLIRHGQASFGAQNYDQLSQIGYSQAQTLGRYYQKQSVHFDQIIHGSLTRQQQTAQNMAEAMKFEGALSQDPALNEFDSENLLKYYLPQLAAQDKQFKPLLNDEWAWSSSEYSFEIVLRALMDLWQADLNCPFESWIDFQARVLGFLNAFSHSTQDVGEITKKIALVTSGGCISVILQSILKLDNDALLDINLSINNASVSEIRRWATPTQPLLDGAFSKSPLSAGPLSTSIGPKETSANNKTAFKLLNFNNISPLLESGLNHLITRK